MNLRKSGLTKIQAIIITVVIVIAVVAGVVVYIGLRGPEQPQKTEIVFGTSLSISGAEIAGPLSYLAGVKVAIDEINEAGGIYVPELGKKLTVRLIVYDDMQDGSKARANFERLITEDKVDFVLSGFGDDCNFAISVVCQSHKMPYITSMILDPSYSERGFDYVFVLFFTPETLGDSSADFIIYLRGKVSENVAPKKVAVLATSDDLKYAGERVKQRLEENGFEVPYFQTYADPGTSDFTPFIREMMRLGVDVVVNTGHSNDASLLIKQMAELNFVPKAIIVNNLAYFDEGFISGLGKYANGIFGAGLKFLAKDPNSMNAILEKSKKYYKAPASEAVFGYTAVYIHKIAIEAVGLDREKVRDYIAVHEFSFPWLQEPIKFNEKRVAPVKVPVVGQIIDGKRYDVFPPEVAQREPIYPMTPWTEK